MYTPGKYGGDTGGSINSPGARAATEPSRLSTAQPLQCSKYNEYVWYIPGISHADWYIHGIYMVYTWYIHGIFHAYGVIIHMYGIYHVKHLWVCSVPFFILIYL